MRKTKILKIDDREITIKELTLRDIYELTDGAKNGILPAMNVLLAKTSSLSLEDIKDFAPSEIQILYSAFLEVNSAFFQIADQLGLKQAATRVLQQIQRDFLNSFANSSVQGTETPGSTATDSPSWH